MRCFTGYEDAAIGLNRHGVGEIVPAEPDVRAALPIEAGVKVAIGVESNDLKIPIVAGDPVVLDGPGRNDLAIIWIGAWRSARVDGNSVTAPLRVKIESTKPGPSQV